ncbi:sensor domain-containing protein [Streptomyces sp. WMMC905]|uniref:sensor domain-containing protein n=1 Tax=Streptomyces sp. WMMC905 TaxID=3404123 RepID=UPI003B9258B4
MATGLGHDRRAPEPGSAHSGSGGRAAHDRAHRSRARRRGGEFGYLLLGPPIGVAFLCCFVLSTVGMGLAPTFLGLPLLAAGLAGCRGLGALERSRARALLGVRIAAPEPTRRRGSGATASMTAVIRDGASWRALLYALLHPPLALVSFVATVTVGTCGVAMLTYPLWFWVFPVFVGEGGVQPYPDGTHEIRWDGPWEIAAIAVGGLLLAALATLLVRAFTTVDRLLVRGLLGARSRA